MFRLISVILLIGGGLAAYLGYLAMTQENIPTPPASSSPSEAVVADTFPAEEPIVLNPASTPTTRSLAAEEPPEEDFIMGTESMTPPAPNVLDTLKTVPIAHETPKSATFGKPFDVTVSIDGTGDNDATDSLAGTGNIVTGSAKVSARAKAELTGSAFDIVLVSDEIQTISPLAENTWTWSVTPRQSGAQQLAITIFAMDGDTVLPVRNYRNTVTVEVSRLGQAIAIAQDANPLAIMLGGIGSALAGLFGAFRFFSSKS